MEQPFIPDSVKNLYRHHKNNQTQPSLLEMSSVLQSVAAMYTRVFIIIDALDECQLFDSSNWKLLTGIFDLQAKYETNLFVTSRFIPDIVDKFSRSIWLEIRATDEDIRIYLESRMYLLPRFVESNSQLQEEIKTEITNDVDGMYVSSLISLIIAFY
jgi:hypothetical protein